MDQHIAVSLPFADQTPEGLPGPDALDQLRALEDELTDRLLPRALLVAHESTQGVRTLHLYADSDDLALAEQVRNAVSAVAWRGAELKRGCRLAGDPPPDGMTSDGPNAAHRRPGMPAPADRNDDNGTVIPKCDVTPAIDVDYASLRVPTAYQVVNGFAVVQDYQPLIDVSWDDARECVEAEARWLDRAAKASTAEDFDRILSTAAAEEAPDDFDWLFRGLDVGVAGLTLVLSAAYYATCFSCRTHPSMAGDHMPQVIMAAEPQRVRALARYAARADCGVENAEDGLVCVYAASVEHHHALAQAMLAARAELEELPQPSWRPRVQEYLSDEDSDEFEWTDNETG